jgi:aminobenzoyl-glutamate transport protein
MPDASQTPSAAPKRGILDFIERLGNKLPEPAILFAILAVLVVIASGIGARVGWEVQPKRLKVETVPVVDAAGNPVVDAAGRAKVKPVLDEKGRPKTTLVDAGAPLTPRSLMTVEGVYWMLSSMIRNFVNLPALGLVFVGMLGIGLAEKFGLFSALMRFLAMLTPKLLLTPMIVFIGANSSVASDAGYIILPPLAAALYLAMGRHPVAGLAAAFAGVAGGFGGGLFPTAADGFLAGTATQAAQIVDPTVRDVLATHNLYFKMGSAFIVTLAGWFVTDRIVEPRLKAAALRDPNAADTAESSTTLREMSLTDTEKRGLFWAAVAHLAVLAVFAAMVFIPGGPLQGDGVQTLSRGQALTRTNIEIVDPHDASKLPGRTVLAEKRPILENGELVDGGYAVLQAPGAPQMIDGPGPRWSHVIVPLIFFAFVVPGLVYGRLTGVVKGQKDVIEGFYHGIRNIVPILAIAFFMGQFVNYFEYSRLDRMLAFAGGQLLLAVDLPIPVLLVLFVLIVVAGDFALSGMLSKFAVMAPIFIPMFMMVGISPELTTAAYRIGDSVVNIITPLNSYLLIILVVLQKYKNNAGLGTLISLMLPYSVIFFVIWTGFLLLWYFSGMVLGPGSPLYYVPAV